MNSSTYFSRRFLRASWNLCWSQGTVIIRKDFSALLDMGSIRNGLIKSTHENTWLSKALTCQFFPKHRIPHFWSVPWTPFRGYWRSSATTAHDLILVEVDGRCQFGGDKSFYAQTLTEHLLYIEMLHSVLNKFQGNLRRSWQLRSQIVPTRITTA